MSQNDPLWRVVEVSQAPDDSRETVVEDKLATISTEGTPETWL
jgi:hypothetical protein